MEKLSLSIDPGMVINKSPSWVCERVWDGVDFSPCFRERYIDNFPLLLVGLSIVYLLSRIPLHFRSRAQPALSPHTLTSASHPSSLSALESTVILESTASNLLPAQAPFSSTNVGEKLASGEAQEIIREFVESKQAGVEMWERIWFWTSLVGGLIWFEVELARGVVHGEWKNVVFPAFLTFLTIIPDAPILPLLTLHLVPALLAFRSDVLQRPSGLGIACSALEVVYWVVLISIPYSANLDRLLEGGVSKGGGSSGSYGSHLPKHCEEPASPFSRATYSFLLPLLFKHYIHPITLKDIPAIREDDAAAAALGSFRAFQARRDEAHAKRNGGQQRKRDLGVDLVLFFAPELVKQAGWGCLCILFEYLPATGLRLLLKFVKHRTKSSQPTEVAVLYVAMMVIGQCFSAITMGQALFLGRRLCNRLRAIVVAEVFAKALRRQDVSGKVKRAAGKDGKVPEGEESASEGKINNLVSVDAFSISEICAYIFYLWSGPLSVIINCVLLYNTLGLASFAGIAVLIAVMPLQGLIGKLFTVCQTRFMAATDARLESVAEVIAYIKLIKFNAWGGKFLERMGATRRKELSALARRMGVTLLFQLFVWGTPVLVTGVAFAVHSLVLGKPLTADRAFASLILFNMIKDPLALFQHSLTMLLQARTSCGRIQEYLDEPDSRKYSVMSVPEKGDPEVGFKGVILTYVVPEDIEGDEEADPFALGELNIEFPAGKLSLVCGPVGSGKTTLLQGLLGEATLFQGKVFMPTHPDRNSCPINPTTGLTNTVAYCAQTPWLVGASIRDNITFGAPWDRARYERVVDACALHRDFEIFDAGDETEVGQNGTTCSGGQKARIALARAVYSPARTIILDDVLSAVDAQTARHLYRHVLQGPLTRGRTVILVTHQVALVGPAAEMVIMLDEGEIVGQGSPAELVSQGLLDLLDESEDGEAGEVEGSAAGTISTSGTTLVPDDVPTLQVQLDSPTDSVKVSVHSPVDSTSATDDKPALPAAIAENKQLAKLVEDESQDQGMVKPATYILYFRAMGGWAFWLIALGAFVGSQALQVGSNAWIKEWANADDRATAAAGNAPDSIIDAFFAEMEKPHSTLFYLLIYWAISAVYLLAVAARVGITFGGALHASRVLYDRLLRRILGARMRFFDSTPSGRILNRLSKDMSVIDQSTGEILMYFTNCCLSAATVLVVVSISTPAFIVALVGIIFLYWVIGSVYVTTNREIKRIESVTKSPILISFSEVLTGTSTIRAYGDSPRFLRKIFHELDQNTRCYWYMWQINHVLHIFSNIVGALVTVFASVFALRNRKMDAGAVGLSISYALTFTDFVLWVVRMYASCEMSMNSVERVGEYLDLPVEEEEDAKGMEPPAHWPSRDGSVVVENLTCRYAPHLDPVLRNVSFTVGPREKIGICGRTGCGKSTLALSFFRFLFQESGTIFIDGQDISKMSLSTLRSRLTILPQEAQLFSGTIRDNLDPFDQHDDSEIWDALSQCGLISRSRTPSRAASRRQSRASLRAANVAAGKTVTKMPSARSLLKKASKRLEVVQYSEDEDEEEEERIVIRSLDESVAAGGKNFSQGQRQLLALARGMLKLKSSSFLIMDESTANLDQETDTTIQNVLRTGLGDTQMLVIAHRLMTVCGLDKILVLDQGRVVEFGTPWELMQKEEGMFRDLCKQSGEEAQLYEVAKNVHEKRQCEDESAFTI
ncbi:hypothetical protein IAT38_001530 [Cryptococcus sp. DSM 104549]